MTVTRQHSPKVKIHSLRSAPILINVKDCNIRSMSQTKWLRNIHVLRGSKHRKNQLISELFLIAKVTFKTYFSECLHVLSAINRVCFILRKISKSTLKHYFYSKLFNIRLSLTSISFNYFIRVSQRNHASETTCHF
ncbi:uncharacterized protein LOC143425696 [Xylocopa sonorina]|uniref:uncharacterized protein LOC143425696 n=1 Tax=Xylocopa sonorina TaxID=1818115 RepID=UPI00403AE65E